MNKAQVEGSISIGYIMDEATKFASFYFKEGDPTLPLKEKQNEVYLDDIVDDDMFEFSSLRVKQSVTKGNGI